MAKPYQRPYPPIVVTAVAPFSQGVAAAAERGWDPISANFLQPQWVKTHWGKYVEGCAKGGRVADPANWRVAKSIFVADNAATAERYATEHQGPYHFYYHSLFTKLLRVGRANLFKTDPDMPTTPSTWRPSLINWSFAAPSIRSSIKSWRTGKPSAISALCSMPGTTGRTRSSRGGPWC